MCDKLTSIELPPNLERIGDNAFNGCAGLKSIVIPDGCTAIGSDAFTGCKNLADIYVPDSVYMLGDDPLLTSLTVRERFACAVGNLESRTFS